MKKNSIKGLLLAFSLGIALTAKAQTPGQKAEIKKHNNSEGLKKISEAGRANYARALELAELNDWPLIIQGEDGTSMLTGVRDNGKPVYKTTSNKGGAATARVNNIRTGGILGLDLNGQDMTIGMWEIGSPRKNHNELTAARVTNGDGSSFTGDDSNGSKINLHATHVAGTLIGSGSVDVNARGMAYQGEMRAFNAGNDIGEAADEAEEGLLISNHSYGLSMDNAENWMPGAYTAESALWDEVMYDAPYYQAVFAAGNDRDGDEKDELLLETTSKNGITVAAVYGLPAGGYVDEDSVEMSTFSTFGPTDDKRIKPDISAKGVDVWSCSSAGNSSHTSLQGTSMAAPGVAGALILFQQHYHNLHDMFMRAATLKALMVHTADEAGDDPGPDYKFGWGLINATKAVMLMTAADQGTASTALIEENSLAQSAVYSFNVTTAGTQPLKATIVWTERATNESVNDNVANSTTPVLTNDLDLRITRVSNGEVFLPWRLNAVSSQGAVKADNEVDNVEVVEILEPEPGQYTITVSHKGNLAGFANQKYSLVVNTINGIMGVDNNRLGAMLSVYPNPAADVINIAVDASINTSDASIVLYDLQGRQVKHFDSFVESINVSDLSSGVYMLTVKMDGAATSKKVIIK